MISNDDKGNGYHGLYFDFTQTDKIFIGLYPPSLTYGVNKEELKDYIILG